VKVDQRGEAKSQFLCKQCGTVNTVSYRTLEKCWIEGLELFCADCGEPIRLPIANCPECGYSFPVNIGELREYSWSNQVYCRKCMTGFAFRIEGLRGDSPYSKVDTRNRVPDIILSTRGHQ